MARRLTKKQIKDLKNDLNKSSRGELEDVFVYLRNHFQKNRWIGVTNRYSANCIKRLEEDSIINERHLKDYIAASVFLHNSDGWSFLSKALYAHMKGDPDISCHLGYYAELRAAMSLLASEGIGVFNSTHFIINSQGNIHKVSVNVGTHIFVWEALKHWASQRSSAELLGDIIRPNAIPLKDWLDAFLGSSTVMKPIADKWLRAWGLDIQKVSKDQNVRNESSYRPNRIPPNKAVMSAEKSLDFVKDFWALFEPSGDSRFQEIDRHLLRRSLELSFKATTGKAPFSGKASLLYKKKIEKMLSILISDTKLHPGWVDFLTWKKEKKDPVLFVKADETSSSNNADNDIQVLSRAALMLRVSSGSSHRLLKDTGTVKKLVSFWWESFAQDHGLLEDPSQLNEMTDLWSDIEGAIDDVNLIQRPFSYQKIHKEQSRAISLLGECGRVSLWGIGL